MLELALMGAASINLITGTHFIPVDQGVFADSQGGGSYPACRVEHFRV